MNNKIQLKVFVGYQVKSKFHTPSQIKSMGDAINNLLIDRGEQIMMTFDYGEFPPGAKLWEQITDKIDSSHVVILDISENNPNVLIEAGIALGTEKHVVFLKSNQSKANYPSDIHNFVYLPYENGATLLEKDFLLSVVESVNYYLNETHDPYFYHRLLWSLIPNAKTFIIPGHLPEIYTGNKFEDYISLRKYSDLDAVFLLVETIHRLHPRMDISIQSARDIQELPKRWEEFNMIFVGGPDFNGVVKEFEDLLPFEYKYGEAGADDEVWLKHKKTQKDYKPVFYEANGQTRAKDYGFFLSIKPGKYKPSKLIFLGGARTWGVYGASQVVSCTGFDKKSRSYTTTMQLVKKFGNNPSLLIPVEVAGSRNGILPPIWRIEDVEQIEETDT